MSGVDSICCLDPDLPLCFLDVLEGDAGEPLLTLAFVLFGLTKQQSCKQCDQVQIEESKGRIYGGTCSTSKHSECSHN